jgi:hypothetical protein
VGVVVGQQDLRSVISTGAGRMLMVMMMLGWRTFLTCWVIFEKNAGCGLELLWISGTIHVNCGPGWEFVGIEVRLWLGGMPYLVLDVIGDTCPY